MSRAISFDRAVDTYDATRSLPPKVMSRAVTKLVAGLERHDCRDVLDSGVGTGRFAVPLQQRGFNVIGIDVSRDMLNLALKKSVKNLFRGDLRQLPFKNKSFDAAIIVHVLHLISEWQQALGELRRVTRNVVCSVIATYPPMKSPSPGDLYESRLLESGWPEIHPGVHERDLVRILPPSEEERVCTLDDDRSSDEILDLLDKRTFSFLWDVPDDLHRRIMSGLRTEFAGKRVKSTSELRICYWDVRIL